MTEILKVSCPFRKSVYASLDDRLLAEQAKHIAQIFDFQIYTYKTVPSDSVCLPSKGIIEN